VTLSLIVVACWLVAAGLGCAGSGLEGTGGGGPGGGGTPTGSPCSTDDVGTSQTCCGTGTQTCGGDAEFATWSPCVDDAGNTLSCTEEPPVPPDDPMPPPDPMCVGEEFPPGSFGTEYECYGFSVADDQVYHLDRMAGTATAICASPGGMGPIEAFAINPITGNSYIIAQETADFGKFIPRSGTATCVLTIMGTFPSSSIGGFAFDRNGVLYAGDEGSGRIWRFQQDPVTRDPLGLWDEIGTLPNGSEGLAMNPIDGLAYNSDGSTIHIVDLANPGQSLFSCDLGGGGFESIFFDQDGTLYSTNNGTNQFVRINVDRAGGGCTTTLQFSVLPAQELEATDCNTGCSYDTCPCVP
jgi:hypothetical protein